MGFGFDPGIILATRQANTLGNGRQMADLLQTRQTMGIQRDQHEATLASMLAKQQQGQRLSDIYKQHAQNPQALGGALLGAGMGEEAMGWMKHQSEADARAATTGKAFQETASQGAEFLSRVFRDVRDQPSLDAGREALKRAGWPEQSIAMLPHTFTPDDPVIRHLASLGVSSKDVFEAQEAEKRQNAQIAAAKDGEKAKSGDGLRAEYNRLPQTQRLVLINEAIQQIQNASNDGAGDLALIFGLSNALDPGAVVRESDVAMVGKTGGLPGQAQGYFNQLMGEGQLKQGVRDQIRKEALKLLDSRTKAFEPTRKFYRAKAEELGLNPDEIFLPVGAATQPQGGGEADTLSTPDGIKWVRQPNGKYLPAE